MSSEMKDSISPTTSCNISEQIGIVALKPRHYDGEKFEPASMFSRTQMEERGVSGVRLSWTTPQEMFKEIVIAGCVNGKTNKPISVITGDIEAFRSVKSTEGLSVFDVWASGMPNLRGHVDIGNSLSFIPNSDNPGAPAHKNDNFRALRALLIDAIFGPNPSTAPSFWPRLGECCSGIKSLSISHPVESKSPTA